MLTPETTHAHQLLSVSLLIQRACLPAWASVISELSIVGVSLRAVLVCFDRYIGLLLSHAPDLFYSTLNSGDTFKDFSLPRPPVRRHLVSVFVLLHRNRTQPRTFHYEAEWSSGLCERSFRADERMMLIAVLESYRSATCSIAQQTSNGCLVRDAVLAVAHQR